MVPMSCCEQKPVQLEDDDVVLLHIMTSTTVIDALARTRVCPKIDPMMHSSPRTMEVSSGTSTTLNFRVLWSAATVDIAFTSRKRALAQLQLPIGQVLAPGKETREGVWNKALSNTCKTRAMTQERQELKVRSFATMMTCELTSLHANGAQSTGEALITSGLLPGCNTDVMWKDLAFTRKVWFGFEEASTLTSFARSKRRCTSS